MGAYIYQGWTYHCVGEVWNEVPITTGETFYEFDGDDTCLGTRPDSKIQSCLTSMTCSELVTIPGWQYNRLPSSGQLSGGASPHGALDMAGNVAEWAAGKPPDIGSCPGFHRELARYGGSQVFKATGVHMEYLPDATTPGKSV
jgi:hypothetical protein